MNTANLQMEGTLLALAALCEALKRKGMLNGEEIAEALAYRAPSERIAAAA